MNNGIIKPMCPDFFIIISKLEYLAIVKPILNRKSGSFIINNAVLCMK